MAVSFICNQCVNEEGTDEHLISSFSVSSNFKGRCFGKILLKEDPVQCLPLIKVCEREAVELGDLRGTQKWS